MLDQSRLSFQFQSFVMQHIIHQFLIYSILFIINPTSCAPGDTLNIVREHAGYIWSIQHQTTIAPNSNDLITYVFSVDDNRAIKQWEYIRPNPSSSVASERLPRLRLIKTFVGHQASVNEIVTWWDWVISVASDATWRQWSLEGVPLKRTSVGVVWAMAISMDGRWLFMGTTTGLVQKISISTGQVVRNMQQHTSAVRCIRWYNNIVFTASYDFRVNQYDSDTGDYVRSYAHTAKARVVEALGTSVFTGGEDSMVREWDFTTGLSIRNYTAPWHIAAMDVKQDRLFVSSNYNLREYSTTTGEFIRAYVGHTDLIYGLRVLDGYLISGGEDLGLRIWETEFGRDNLTWPNMTRMITPSSTLTTPTHLGSVLRSSLSMSVPGDAVTPPPSAPTPVKPHNPLESSSATAADDDDDESKPATEASSQQVINLSMNLSLLIAWGTINVVLLLSTLMVGMVYRRRNKQLATYVETSQTTTPTAHSKSHS